VLFWADNAQHKRELLDHWLRDASIDQAIVFASTQIECDGLATDLQQAGFAAVALHGALSQGLRNRRLMALRNGQVQILVATDVAARGIDVPTITHVFNFGLPMKAEDYTHRIGRTGRAGRDGIAVTLAEFRDRRKIGDIEAYTKQPFKSEVIPGLEPKQRFDAPRKSFGGKGGKGGKPAGKGRGFGDRGYNDRGFGDRGFSDRGAPAAGWGQRGDARFDGRGQERFEGRFEGGRSEQRFEGRSEGGRFDNRSEGRFDGRQDRRGDARGPARDGQRPAHGHAPTHFERRDDRAPRAFDKAPHGGRANARAGAGAGAGERGGDKFSHRGPKQIGGGFKPHSAKKRG